MRTLAFFAPLLAVAFVGCLSDPRDDHSAGYSCGSLGPPNVQLRAVDAATGVPVPFTVTVDGAAPPSGAGCVSLVDGGTSEDMPCTGDVEFELFGPATIVVSSDGYAPATLHLDGGNSGGPCPAPLYAFDLWVPLTANP